MRYHNYIFERKVAFGDDKDYKIRRKEIPFEEAKRIINKHCTKALYKGRNDRIFRGIMDGWDSFWVQPSQQERKSRNTENHYTLMLDHFPEWQQYPKRSRSIVCTTEFSTARLYGRPYIVFPVDGSKIGVASYEDIWGSFKKFAPMNLFTGRLIALVKDSKVFLVRKKIQTDFTAIDVDKFEKASSYEDILKGFSFIDDNKEILKEAADMANSEIGHTSYYLGLHEGYWTSDQKLIDYLRQNLDPVKNGFDLVTIGDALPARREVWTDGDCVLVRNESRLTNNLYNL